MKDWQSEGKGGREFGQDGQKKKRRDLREEKKVNRKRTLISLEGTETTADRIRQKAGRGTDLSLNRKKKKGQAFANAERTVRWGKKGGRDVLH